MDAEGDALRSAAMKACSMRGFVLRQDALLAITRQVRAQESPDAALSIILDGVQAYLERTKQAGVAIDAYIIEEVVATATRDDEDVKQESIVIKSSFAQPKFSYDAGRQVYVK